jgi:hypothetical protein
MLPFYHLSSFDSRAEPLSGAGRRWKQTARAPELTREVRPPGGRTDR